MKKPILILICLLLLVLVGCAKPAIKDEFESDKPWIEQLTQIPAYPDEHNLLAFDPGAVTDNRYLVDTNSIKIGGDGVIRFTLVVKSSAGAMNVSYEGIRCATDERKLYALGRNDRTWAQPRISEWQKIDLVRQFYAQRELAKNIFCPHRQIVPNSKAAIEALKAGIHRDIFR